MLRVLAWLFRLLLFPLGIRIWWIAANIRAVPLTDISWIYLFLYCISTLILIGYMLLALEVLLIPDQVPNDVRIYYVGTSICVLLSVLFPLVVITHWLFCSKRSWHYAFILPAYIALIALIWLLRTFSPLLGLVFNLKNVVMTFAILHIYPSFMAANPWGMVGAGLTILATLMGSTITSAGSKTSLFVYLLAAMSAASVMVMSFTPMMLEIPTLNSDSASYYKYFMSKVGAGAYVGDVEYHCYGTSPIFGVNFRT